MTRWKDDEKMKIEKRGLNDEKMTKWWKDGAQLNIDN